MIEKLDIRKYGSYTDFLWNKNIADTNFANLNIIYGRNYSGKTTLSRIFQSIQTGELHSDFTNSEFSFHLASGTVHTQDDLLQLQNQIKVRVYNTDFVKTNLSWFFNNDGTIHPFTVLGEKNVENERQLLSITSTLGSVDTNKGLLYEYDVLTKDQATKEKLYRDAQSKLDRKLKSEAQAIKIKGDIFNKPIYTILSIKKDLEKVGAQGSPSYVLDNDNKNMKMRLLREDAKDNMRELSKVNINLSDDLEKTNKLLTQKIKPSEPISELINDSLLQEWVRKGITYHKNKRQTCGFCGGPLSSDLWHKLGAHFDEESDNLRRDIDKQIKTLEMKRIEVLSYVGLNTNSFYIDLQDSYYEILNEWNLLLKDFNDISESLIFELKSRKDNIFKESFPLSYNKDLDHLSNQIIDKFNTLILKNNNKTKNLNKEQDSARNELLMDRVATFHSNIQYEDELTTINNFKVEAQKASIRSKTKQNEIKLLLENKESLEANMKDESRGAELVNNHLNNYFGHGELRLVSEGNSPNIRFTIYRDNEEAKNLSEGECSLISFCYFMAQIEDELNSADSKNKLVIYVDDPISSLDGNHIFYMFSLIESIIAKNKQYLQLFVSTHNLDFLKYLKRLTKPNGETSISHFLIEKRFQRNDSRSYLIKMPTHIKEYVTEFNYLFNEIYNLYRESRGDRKKMLENTYNHFYNLPNNIRKFLECYLFYKYPNTLTPLENLPKLFNGSVPTLLNRVINEYSHLVYLDRGWKPVDVDEMEKCVEIIIKRLEEVDPEQFYSLLESIGVQQRLPLGAN
ncbi:AAA family ATPase [Terribacillus saccharophilus]|uniref:AAA family ATPase n=1 Tax=Terribacillus saccharophilus TaxID=361277 RepID=UPI0015957D58|nr:AAA family ATPase [Terribacillus saccharophilus]